MEVFKYLKPASRFMRLLMLFPLLSCSQTVVYKSNDELTVSKFKLNFADSTYTYDEEYILKPGDDVGYHYESNGTFKKDNDTLTFISNMPGNDFLPEHMHELTLDEITKNKFSYIYPVIESVEAGYVKIYFDNIAEIDGYEAYALIDNKLQPLKIKSRLKLTGEKSIQTKNNQIPLFHYLLIERPLSKKLLIISSKDNITSESYLFDFDKIPYNSFHFFTRVYNNYYDFTGVKFKITPEGIQMIEQKNDLRYRSNSVIKNEFIKEK
ncbi:hypothetical protein [Pedobacter punctiformis]|uniref:Uncharacterized protein n=1 Tax=Pedobacter punctiformis TaxID=3004097 RepID=A0ABT4L8G1_9SPHI|nr:hypothetical protein [Pedobacter sp. HCMS5-2]MCZ4244121.1 hypothetical protein [Pedobacter sp. HCMS5-2]